MVLIYLSVLVVLTIVLYFYFTRSFNYWKKRNVKTLKPIPFFGNMWETSLRRIPFLIAFKDSYEKFPEEKVVGVYRMTTPALLLRDLDAIKYVMVKDFDNFVDRGLEFSKKGLNANIFQLDGESWRILRNKFTPIFTSGKLKNMLYLINERADKFVDLVGSLPEKEQEVHKLVQKFTMSTISACAFGFDLDYDDEKFKTLAKIDQLIFTTSFVTELDMLFPGILKALSANFFPPHVTNFFYNMVETIIQQRNNKPSTRKDFMDLILEMRNEKELKGGKRNEGDVDNILEITKDVIAAQAFVFYVAGYETSATTMAFMLYQLAINPDIQDRLLSEIDEVLDRYNGELTYECLNDMVYLGKVFDETLRMYPVVDPLQRQARADYKLPGTDLTIEKDMMVYVSVMGIHYDEKYYPDPYKFDPERFSPEQIANRHMCAYMPFGHGPRNCIGMRFARVQSRVCMVKFLSKFRVERSKSTKVTMQFDGWRPILGPKNGLYMNIIRRK